MTEPNSTSTNPTSAVVSPLVGKKVFIFEDDVFLGKILAGHLIKENIAVTVIPSGERAFETIKQEMPDIIMLDLFLPGIGGMELLELLRKDPATEKIPVVVASNTDRKDDKEKATSLNAEFLIKAVTSPEEIRKCMEGMMVVS